MSLIVLTSASGSPGVTATALGLALTWPRPVMLVEADPTGGSAVSAGYLRGATTPPDSLIDLALAHREGGLLAALPQVTMTLPGSSVTLLPGTRSHEQARSLLGLWEPLTGALKSLERTGQDVLVDAGRLGLYGWPEPLVYGADLTLLVTRTDLVSLSGARSWAETLRGRFERTGARPSLGVLLVGEGEPYRAREVAKLLQVPVVASLAWDPVVAAVLAKGAEPPRPSALQRLADLDPFDDSALLRSVRAARTAIEATIATNRDHLQAVPAGRQM